jgi:hypothetical protein
LLLEGQDTTFYLYNTDEKKIHIIVSQWLNVYRTGLEIFGKRLTRDDAVARDEATQAGSRAGSIRATNKTRSW